PRTAAEAQQPTRRTSPGQCTPARSVADDDCNRCATTRSMPWLHADPQTTRWPAARPQAAVKALRVTVLPRSAWFNVQRLHARARQEVLQRPGNELRPVVAAN